MEQSSKLPTRDGKISSVGACVPTRLGGGDWRREEEEEAERSGRGRYSSSKIKSKRFPDSLWSC